MPKIKLNLETRKDEKGNVINAPTRYMIEIEVNGYLMTGVWLMESRIGDAIEHCRRISEELCVYWYFINGKEKKNEHDPFE